LGLGASGAFFRVDGKNSLLQFIELFISVQFLTRKQYWWYCYLSYATSMILSKASIACFLLRITPNRIHRWIICSALGISVCCGLAFFFVALFQCSPVEYFWTRTGPGSCISIEVIIDFVYTYSALSIVTDFTFTILPVWLVCRLQMDRNVKLALIPILSMACIASCAVAVRLAYLQNFRTNDFLCTFSLHPGHAFSEAVC
jgi:hypothetical protein